MGASASTIPDDCVVLVTGASRGIGKVRFAAAHFGPHTHIVVRYASSI
jgi:NAD(P)-dependent dehydrogenase (short-subunit alcohol dehydrogenase family)